MAASVSSVDSSASTSSSVVSMSEPQYRDIGQFFLELADNWEYTGFQMDTDELADVRFQEGLKEDFWHEVQVRAARCLKVVMEVEEGGEEGSVGVVFKIQNYIMKRGKLTHNLAATTTLIARRDSHSSFWLHIVDPEIAGRLGVTLLTMRKVCEAVFGMVLVKKPKINESRSDDELMELILKAREEIEIQIKTEPEEEEEVEVDASPQSNKDEGEADLSSELKMENGS